MPMYSRQTSVSTQLGGRPTIVFSGDVSSTQQHSIIQGHATEEEEVVLASDWKIQAICAVLEMVTVGNQF